VSSRKYLYHLKICADRTFSYVGIWISERFAGKIGGMGEALELVGPLFQKPESSTLQTVMTVTKYVMQLKAVVS